MKKLFVIIVLIAKCHILLSQENKLVVFFVDAVTSGVPVYPNDTDTFSIAVVKENTEKENWHDVELLGQSKNRYKVRVIAINENHVAPIVGWVDKEQCGVWLWGKYMKPDHWIVSLYHLPSNKYPFLKISDKDIDGFGTYTDNKAVPVLNYKLYKGHYWIKTEIIREQKRTIGWTRDYCSNVYGSCN